MGLKIGLLKELFNFLVAIALATLLHERKAVACRYVKLSVGIFSSILVKSDFCSKTFLYT